jgi:hypothetical protein
VTHIRFMTAQPEIDVTQGSDTRVKQMCGWNSALGASHRQPVQKDIDSGDQRCTEPFDFLRHSR